MMRIVMLAVFLAGLTPPLSPPLLAQEGKISPEARLSFRPARVEGVAFDYLGTVGVEVESGIPPRPLKKGELKDGDRNIAAPHTKIRVGGEIGAERQDGELFDNYSAWSIVGWRKFYSSYKTEVTPAERTNRQSVAIERVIWSVPPHDSPRQPGGRFSLRSGITLTAEKYRDGRWASSESIVFSYKKVGGTGSMITDGDLVHIYQFEMEWDLGAGFRFIVDYERVNGEDFPRGEIGWKKTYGF